PRQPANALRRSFDWAWFAMSSEMDQAQHPGCQHLEPKEAHRGPKQPRVRRWDGSQAGLRQTEKNQQQEQWTGQIREDAVGEIESVPEPDAGRQDEPVMLEVALAPPSVTLTVGEDVRWKLVKRAAPINQPAHFPS